MTSLATVIGLVPMALKLGTGSEAYAPLARAIIGGLMVSVALTVFIVPAAYLLVYGRRTCRSQGDSVVMRRILLVVCVLLRLPVGALRSLGPDGAVVA